MATKTRTRAATRARATAPAAPPDRVTQYAVRVLQGSAQFTRLDREQPAYRSAVARYRASLGEPEPIAAGRAVRLACERHFLDLARQRTEAFPFYFDQAAADHIIDFFPTFLTLERGEPFELPLWLQFCYGSIYGWKCSEGPRVDYRRYVHGYFETSKGSGKTPSAGGIGLYGITFDDEPAAQVYTTGFDEGQASIIIDDAIRMARASPELLEMLIVDKYNIANPSLGAFMRAMSSQHRSKSGPRPHYVLSDEIHEHRDGTVVTKAEAGFKGRLQPLGLKFTNSGDNRQSYCWQLHQKSLSVLDGTLTDEQWFAYVCHLDPCAACYEEGYRQPKDGCPSCDDWKDPAVWPKIAPALGVVIQPKYLQDAVDAALSLPSEYATKRRLNFCIWTETHRAWISPERWNACRVDRVSENNDHLVAAAAGLDPSSVLDTTSLVVALRVDHADESGETVQIEGLDELGQQVTLTFTLNFHVEIVPFIWIPKATMLERVATERIPFDVWHRAGHLRVTEGPAIDHEAIYRSIVDDLWKRYRLQRLGMDENHGRFLFLKLQNEGRLGKQIVSVGQAKKLSEAFKFIEILVAHKRIRHAGNPVADWQLANAEPHTDRLGALWVEKPEEKKRIDFVIALAMAISQLMVLPVRKKTVSAFVV